MLNNRGVTLVEVLVSLVLISAIMIILNSLLSDLKNEDSLSSARSQDAITRSSAVNVIQKDFDTKKLVNMTGCNQGTVCVKFDFKDGSSKTLIITKNSDYTSEYLTEIKYVDSGTSNKPDTWYLKYAELIMEGNTVENLRYNYTITDNGNAAKGFSATVESPYFYVEIRIPLRTSKDTRINYDLLLSYMGKTSDLPTATDKRFADHIVINGTTYFSS